MTTSDIYTLSLHDALPIWAARGNMVEARVRRDAIKPGAEGPPSLAREPRPRPPGPGERLLHKVFGVLERADHAVDRKSTRLNSSHQIISYAVFCLKKKNQY